MYFLIAYKTYINIWYSQFSKVLPLPSCHAVLRSMPFIIRSGKFPKKLWCCISLRRKRYRSTRTKSGPREGVFRIRAAREMGREQKRWPECEKLLRAARISFASHGNACYAGYCCVRGEHNKVIWFTQSLG